MRTIRRILPVGLIATPLLALAQTVETLADRVRNIVNILIPILIAIALVYFIVGVIQYITAGGEEDKRKEARDRIIYGVIGLFAIVAVWGLVGIVANFFGVTPGGTIQIPRF